MIVKCGCSSENIQSGEGDNLEIDYNRKGISLNDIVNSFKGELFNFNFIVIKCYNLVFNAIILKTNLGFIIMISLIGLEILFLIYFSRKCLIPVKNYMLVFEPFDPNIDPPNPPRKSRNNKIQILNSENSNIYNNNENNTDNNQNSVKKDNEIQKKILINSSISKKSSPKKNINKYNNFFINKNKNNKRYSEEKDINDDVLVIHYDNSEEESEKSNSFNFKKNNDSSNFSKTESDLEDNNKQKIVISLNKTIKDNNNLNISSRNDSLFKNKTFFLSNKNMRKNLNI